MKNTKLSKKLNKFKSSPLVVAVAIVEVILLVCVSTFAWFSLSKTTTITTDIISVEPDSGLDIDFNVADKDSIVHINKYISNFAFEPVTSLDGRNIFVPTTGTFNAYAGDVSPDTPSSPENPGDTQNTYLIYFDTKGTGWEKIPYIECNFTNAERDTIAMTRLNSTSTIYYYDLAPLLNKYNYMKFTFMKFKNGKGGNGMANITNMFGTENNCIYPTLLANYLYKCELDSNDKAIQGKQNNHYGLRVLKPEPYSGTVPDNGGGGTGNSGSGEGSGAVADKGGMKFREATVNDMNSKYINIDFTLTNTGDEPKDVWFNSDSYFKVNDVSRTGKALRLAFYSNDGADGDVTSDMLEGGGSATVPDQGGSGGDDSSKYMVYFDKTGTFTYENDNEHSDPKKIWDTVYIEADFLASYPEANNKRMEMQRIGDTNIYCLDLKPVLEYNSSADFSFVKFRSSANKDHTWNMTTQTGKIQNGYIYRPAKKDQNDDFGYVDTVNSHTGIVLAEPEEYKVDPDEDDDIPTDTPVDGSTEFVTVYYYNKLGWETPYAYVYKNDSDKLKSWPGVPMTKVAGDIYYITFNKKYTNIVFNDGRNSLPWTQTVSTEVDAGYIYSPTTRNTAEENKSGNANKTIYNVEKKKYISGNEGVTYPVISPGAPAGFKQPYAPVLTIDNNNGDALSVIPAFASSFEEYSYGSDKKLFSIAPQQTINLSMIIWLEGTDDDCINKNYLGKYIDLKLIFATKEFPEDMYTYKFLDKTKETWLHHNITTESGATFKPVIQLYDNTANRGYLMKEVKDSEGNIIEYKTLAPKGVSKHDITFRRVNPLDATEAWNFWEAGVPTVYAFSDSDTTDDKGFDTVTFSAFADGLPGVVSKTADNPETTRIPVTDNRSCGGLWGEHNTKLLTIYDGTEDQWLKNTGSDTSLKDKTTGVLSITYTYGGQTIEYKGSGPEYNSFYHFVVPESVINADTPLYVSRYYYFNKDYAINKKENADNLKYHHTWNIGKYSGTHYQIGEKDLNKCYWGSDMLYIQDLHNVSGIPDVARMQIRFYKDSTERKGNLNLNNNFQDSGQGCSYACVVPNDKVYSNYQVLRVNKDINSSDIWSRTVSYEVKHPSGTTNNYVEKNICVIDKTEHTIFFQTNLSSEHPYIMQYNDFNDNSGFKDMGDAVATYDNGSLKQYKYTIDTYKYNHYEIEIGWEGSTYDSGRQNVEISTPNGAIYEAKQKGEYKYIGVKSGYDSLQTLHTYLTNTSDWP